MRNKLAKNSSRDVLLGRQSRNYALTVSAVAKNKGR
jgi:hypothetical protein